MLTSLENDSVYKQLLLHFFSGSHKFTLAPENLERMSWEWQEMFLKATMNHKLLKKYPVSNKFIILFLKRLISYIERGQEVHNDFYSHLCAAMEHCPREDSFSYRHYVIMEDFNKIVTIKETRSMVVDGTTGLRTWEAALMLSDWAISNQNLFAEKNVLELGSGVGFAGITIGKYCDTHSVILTDFHNEVLNVACENIEINFPQLVRNNLDAATLFKNKNDQLTMGALSLDWNKCGDICKDQRPDILIGADIVYDPSILEPLCNVIKIFYERNKDLQVFISSVIRNEETFDSFLKTLHSMDFTYLKMETKSKHIKWDENVNRCLLKINCKH